MDDQVIKLILDMGKSGADVESVRAELERLKGTAREASGGYELLERATGTYTVAAGKEQKELDALVRRAAEATAAHRMLADSLEDTAEATVQVSTASTGAVGSKSAGGRGLLGLSYAVQDFSSVMASGGGLEALPRALGSIANNVDQVGLAAGLSGTQVAALSMGFSGLVALLPILIPYIRQFIDSWGTGQAREAIPQATGRIEALTESLRRNRDALEELRKKQELSVLELEKYHELAAKVAGEEDKLATARAARSVRAETDTTKKYGAAFRKSVAERGGSEELLNELVALGVDETTAERMIENALHGNRMDINAIMRKTIPLGRRAFQNFWAPNDPVTVQEAKDREKKLKEFDRQEEKSRREKVQEQKQDVAHDLAETHREYDAWKKAHDEEERLARRAAARGVPTMAQIGQHQTEQLAGQGAARLSQIAGFGKPTRAQSDQMGKDVARNVQKGMGRDQATVAAVMSMLERLGVASHGNQAMIAQRLQMVERQIAGMQRIRRNLEQPPTQGGLGR